jgi:hypothetical protein
MCKGFEVQLQALRSSIEDGGELPTPRSEHFIPGEMASSIQYTEEWLGFRLELKAVPKKFIEAEGAMNTMI